MSAVSPSPPGSGALTVGVDIGGSKVLAGVVDAEGTVLARARRDTPGRSVEAVEDVVVELVRLLGEQHVVGAVGVGAAGLVDLERSHVVFAPHLAWRGEPLRGQLRDRLAVPVVVDNDANLAGLAEARHGAGVGHRIVLCLTMGTGIGGAVVLDGRLYRGAHGMAGEFGHCQVVPEGLPCPCGNRGCWEQYASGTALVRAARERVLAGSPRAAVLREHCGGDAAALTGPTVTRAARAGDPLSTELLGDVGRWLGVGLANLAAVLDPSCIVIGGGVSEADGLLLGPARAAFGEQLLGSGHRPQPPIVAAALGPDAGFIGAATVAREVLSS